MERYGDDVETGLERKEGWNRGWANWEYIYFVGSEIVVGGRGNLLDFWSTSPLPAEYYLEMVE